MEIPLGDIVNSYRQRLSDAVHQIVVLELHIAELNKQAQERTDAVNDLTIQLNTARSTTNSETTIDEPESWIVDNGNSNS